MSLYKYAKEIESLEFQIQFSVIGGIEILQLAMERHPTLVSLRSEITNDELMTDAVFHRIVCLLERVETETKLSLDESIAAYLFCLLKEKPISAYRASWRILEFGGLWWSVQLAQFVKETSREILATLDTSDTDSETFEFSSTNWTGFSDADDIDIAYASRDFCDFTIRSKAQVKNTRVRYRIAFGNQARTNLKLKKTFEIRDSLDLHRYFELVR